jgi:hypothetical protein
MTIKEQDRLVAVVAAVVEMNKENKEFTDIDIIKGYTLLANTFRADNLSLEDFETAIKRNPIARDHVLRLGIKRSAMQN